MLDPRDRSILSGIAKAGLFGGVALGIACRLGPKAPVENPDLLVEGTRLGLELLRPPPGPLGVVPRGDLAGFDARGRMAQLERFLKATWAQGDLVRLHRAAWDLHVLGGGDRATRRIEAWVALERGVGLAKALEHLDPKDHQGPLALRLRRRLDPSFEPKSLFPTPDLVQDPDGWVDAQLLKAGPELEAARPSFESEFPGRLDPRLFSAILSQRLSEALPDPTWWRDLETLPKSRATESLRRLAQLRARHPLVSIPRALGQPGALGNQAWLAWVQARSPAWSEGQNSSDSGPTPFLNLEDRRPSRRAWDGKRRVLVFEFPRVSLQQLFDLAREGSSPQIGRCLERGAWIDFQAPLSPAPDLSKLDLRDSEVLVEIPETDPTESSLSLWHRGGVEPRPLRDVVSLEAPSPVPPPSLGQEPWPPEVVEVFQAEQLRLRPWIHATVAVLLELEPRLAWAKLPETELLQALSKARHDLRTASKDATWGPRTGLPLAWLSPGARLAARSKLLGDRWEGLLGALVPAMDQEDSWILFSRGEPEGPASGGKSGWMIFASPASVPGPLAWTGKPAPSVLEVLEFALYQARGRPGEPPSPFQGLSVPSGSNPFQHLRPVEAPADFRTEPRAESSRSSR